MDITIRRAAPEDKPGWLWMRHLLWSDAPIAELESDLDSILSNPRQPVFLASASDGRLVGFVEAGTRDYGEGAHTSPVGYIEGWYVDPDLRRQGIGRRLVEAAEEWARQNGCQEMGSDTWLDNDASIQGHLRMGYQEVERLIHFVKRL